MLVRVRDLDLSFDGDRIRLRAPTRGIGARVPTMAVAVLSFCSEPRSKEQVTQVFGPPGGQLFEGLAQLGVLVPPKEALDTPVFFQNFASLDTHRRMLKDRVRLEAYRDALEEVVQSDHIVLDAGTGSGVLAMLAAKAGATRVHGIDNAEVVEHAQAVIDANGLTNRVRLHAGDFAKVQIDEHIDVLVTETFGALAYAEGATPDLVACLANNGPGATVVPSHVELWAAPVGMETRAAVMQGFQDFEGLAFSPLEQASRHRGVSTEIPEDALLAAPVRLSRREWPRDSDAFASSASWDVSGHVGGICAWFELQMSPSVRLSTSPAAPLTHWRQTFLPLDPVDVSATLTLDVELGPPPSDRRGYALEGRLGVDGAEYPVHWRVR